MVVTFSFWLDHHSDQNSKYWKLTLVNHLIISFCREICEFDLRINWNTIHSLIVMVINSMSPPPQSCWALRRMSKSVLYCAKENNKSVALMRRSQSWPTKYRQHNGSATHSLRHISTGQLSLGADVRSEKRTNRSRLINPSRLTINNRITRQDSLTRGLHTHPVNLLHFWIERVITRCNIC